MAAPWHISSRSYVTKPDYVLLAVDRHHKRFKLEGDPFDERLLAPEYWKEER